jgi:hypothetical protein
VTPDEAVDVQIVPSEVSTLPEVPGETVFKADILLPNKTPLEVKELEPVPPFATGKVPVTPVVRGKPVALVRVPEVGVPNTGATKVLLVNVVVLVAVTKFVGVIIEERIVIFLSAHYYCKCNSFTY